MVVDFIAMAGLATEIGVVMLAYLDESYGRRRAQGHMRTTGDLHAAVTGGVVERVRPVLMPLSTTVIGLLPVMLGTATGSQVMKRIASLMVSGLISATILTLVIIPTI